MPQDVSLATEIRGDPLTRDAFERPYRSPVLHPLALLAIWLGISSLFALQEYVEMRHTANASSLGVTMTLWGIYSILTATAFVGTWSLLRSRIETAHWRFFVLGLLPYSLAVAVLEDVLYILIFPHFVTPKVPRPFFERLVMTLSGDVVTNMVGFWVGIVTARGVGYYESFRQKEVTASRLETELVGAQLQALRMQLNPHFLFNTMNGVSSLMRENVDAADRMLEQLAMLLRMTLDRGERQEVSLREEMEFIQLYLEIQRTRFGERVRYEMDISAQTLDALIPTMILQPVVENAYRHGVGSASGGGRIWITSTVEGGGLAVRVRNTGDGVEKTSERDRAGIGVKNVRSRLRLHYQDRQSFTLRESEPGITEALLKMPLASDWSAAQLSKGELRA